VRLDAFAAVLFDMDGVLVVNARFHFEAWRRCARDTVGLDLSDAELLALDGRVNREMVAHLLGRSPTEAEVAAIAGRKEATYRRIARGGLAPTPGLIEYLDRLATRGMKTAVVTSAERANLEFVLGELGVSDRFDARVCADDIRAGKPDPEPYLTAAARLGVAATACLVHEDSVSGVESAVAAGATVAALTTSRAAETLRGAGAAWTGPDFRAWLAEVRP
jgi:HAD superfamily hydrolase (TIGR01509 family)